MASIHADSKGDGTEKQIFKGDKGLLFREMVRNFITVSALNASVVRKGRNCILKCCPNHTSINSCLKYVLNMHTLDLCMNMDSQT